MKHDYYKFPMHIIIHPFDGFWDMKYEGRGRISAVFYIITALILVTIIQRQFAGFLVNFNDPMMMNSLYEIRAILLPFFLWCIGNWSISTLMDGEGKFKEILMATAYSLVPIILIFLPATILSNFLTQEETAFYYLAIVIALIWSLYLLFIGTMVVHQYSATKTIITMALTMIAMLIAVFLGLLVYSLIVQIIDFFVSLYSEFIFRT